jgi:transposase
MRSHTAAAVDGATGEITAGTTVEARRAGHEELLRWARSQGEDVLFAIEDVRQCSGALERLLIGHGETVVRVTPKLMGKSRRQARQHGKSDEIDAVAIARAALREPDLPRAQLAGPDHEIRLLVDHRQDLVQERTRLHCRVRWHLHDLDPDALPPNKALRRQMWTEQVARYLARQEQTPQVVICRELVRRNRELNKRIRELERELLALVRRHAPGLLEVEGCGPLCAARIIGEVAGISRFQNPGQLAMHAGVAPILAASGQVQRHRLNRWGNRQLNSAFHTIAMVQARDWERAQAYMAKKQAEGKSKREALRCLKRHLARRIFRVLMEAEARQLRPAEG